MQRASALPAPMWTFGHVAMSPFLGPPPLFRQNPKNTPRERQVLLLNRPVSEENRPVSEENRPVSERTRQVLEENRPVSERTRPVSEENRPVSERKRPVPERDGPVSERNGPVQERVVDVAFPAPRPHSGHFVPPHAYPHLGHKPRRRRKRSRHPNAASQAA